MTGDELERAIEFLLKNQAAYEARQAAYEARQAAVDAQFEAEREKTNQQIISVAEMQQATQRQLDHLTNVVASIAETTRRNSEDIDALVKLVGGLVEGRNGQSGS
ncbi:MAG TPA: hypothetical protein VGB61_01385 [Pyrinomonadaceae bacterium]|jgi:LytS/YehU family sensor histidine kinase